MRDPSAPLCAGTGSCLNGGRPPSAHYVAISTVQDLGCGATADGTLACWGLDDQYAIGQAPSGSDFTSIKLGSQASCALRRSGEVTCWGERGSFISKPLPERALQLLMIGGDRCVLLESGSVRCDGTDTPAMGPADTHFARISGGKSLSWSAGMCGLFENGKIRCWDTPALERITPLPGPYRELANTGEDVCALRGDGVMECWGLNWGNGGGHETCKLTEARLTIGGTLRSLDVSDVAWGIRHPPSASDWTFVGGTRGDWRAGPDAIPFAMISGTDLRVRRIGETYQAFPDGVPIEMSESVWALDATSSSPARPPAKPDSAQD